MFDEQRPYERLDELDPLLFQVDSKHKLIRKFTVTTASTHDSVEFKNLIDDQEREGKIFADSAYRSQEHEKLLDEKKLKSHIHERAYRNKPLTPEQMESNRVKSKVRARVEHVFGHMITAMGGLMVHVMGLERA